uniref:Uncharacterized protein n=1 Tax=Anopheles coluzzii TaxID=1518534 RepID=A0A8W7PAX8_ANOCL
MEISNFCRCIYVTSPVVNSQYRKLCVWLIVRRQLYVLLFAFMQKQNGLSSHIGSVRQWLLSWLKQFIRSDRHSFSIFAFLMRLRSFFRWRSSFSRRRVSRASSFSSGTGLCGEQEEDEDHLLNHLQQSNLVLLLWSLCWMKPTKTYCHYTVPPTLPDAVHDGHDAAFHWYDAFHHHNRYDCTSE